MDIMKHPPYSCVLAVCVCLMICATQMQGVQSKSVKTTRQPIPRSVQRKAGRTSVNSTKVPLVTNSKNPTSSTLLPLVKQQQQRTNKPIVNKTGKFPRPRYPQKKKQQGVQSKSVKTTQQPIPRNAQLPTKGGHTSAYSTNPPLVTSKRNPTANSTLLPLVKQQSDNKTNVPSVARSYYPQENRKALKRRPGKICYRLTNETGTELIQKTGGQRTVKRICYPVTNVTRTLLKEGKLFGVWKTKPQPLMKENTNKTITNENTNTDAKGDYTHVTQVPRPGFSLQNRTGERRRPRGRICYRLTNETSKQLTLKTASSGNQQKTVNRICYPLTKATRRLLRSGKLFPPLAVIKREADAQTELSVHANLADDFLIVRWTVANADSIQFQGFQVECMHGDKETDKADHVSPILHPAMRSYTPGNWSMGGHYNVCVDLLLNHTFILHRQCSIVEAEAETLGNIVVGILAGCIFLTPCIIFIIYILAKDRSLRKRSQKCANPVPSDEYLCSDHSIFGSVPDTRGSHILPSQQLKQTGQATLHSNNTVKKLQPHVIAKQLADNHTTVTPTPIQSDANVKTNGLHPQVQLADKELKDVASPDIPDVELEDSLLDLDALLYRLQHFSESDYDMRESTL